MTRWGELIPHSEDDPACLCGCQDEDSANGQAEEAEGTEHLVEHQRQWKTDLDHPRKTPQTEEVTP